MKHTTLLALHLVFASVIAVSSVSAQGIGTGTSLDAQVFSGVDFSFQINNAYLVGATAGVTIDARGFGDPVMGTTNPFAPATGNTTAKSGVLYLGNYRIFTSVAWVIPVYGWIIHGSAPPPKANLGLQGTVLIACNQAMGNAEGCNSSSNPNFPGSGYQVQFSWPHGPFFGVPPIILDSSTPVCSVPPKAWLLAANVSSGTLTGNAVIKSGGSCSGPITCTIGSGSGSGSGGTCTATVSGGVVTQVSVSGGTGYDQGLYNALIFLGGGGTGGQCADVPLNSVVSGCSEDSSTGGWGRDLFGSSIWNMSFSNNNVSHTFSIYTMNAQENTGWHYGQSFDWADSSAAVFYDTAGQGASASGSSNSQATHFTVDHIQATATGSSCTNVCGDTFGIVQVGNTTAINLSQGSCTSQPFAYPTGIANGTFSAAQVSYDGGGGCGATNPVCTVLSFSGVGLHCAVTVSPGGGSHPNVVTAITISGSSVNQGYATNLKAGAFEVSDSTLTGSSSVRICGGVLFDGTMNASAHNIHAEYLSGTGSGSYCTAYQGYLPGNNAIGAAVRLGTGQAPISGGFLYGIDTANGAKSAVVYLAAGVDNNQRLGSILAGSGQTIQDDANCGNSEISPLGSFPCPVGSGGSVTTTQSGGAVTTCPVSTGGSGYSIPPIAIVTGGGGNGALLSISVSGGIVSSCTVVEGGSGYTSAPTATLYNATAIFTPTKVQQYDAGGLGPLWGGWITGFLGGNSPPDVGISRDSAGVWDFGNGNYQDTSAKLQFNTIAKYAGNSTLNNGVPSEVCCTFPSSATTAPITATNLISMSPATTTFYRISFYAVQGSQTGSGGTCNVATGVAANIIFQDPLDTSGSTTVVVANFTTTTAAGAANTPLALQSSGTGLTLVESGDQYIFRAKASTSVQYSTTLTLGNCSTPPSYYIVPILEEL